MAAALAIPHPVGSSWITGFTSGPDLLRHRPRAAKRCGAGTDWR